MGLSPEQQASFSGLSPYWAERIKAAREAQVAGLKLQMQGPINDLDALRNTPSPAATVMANPGLRAQFAAFAPHFGINPNDPAQVNDNSVRLVLGGLANQLRGRSGQESKDYPLPLQNVNLGQGETAQVEPVSGKKVGDLTERQVPSFTLVDKYDPNTGETTKVPVQTGGYGMNGLGPNGQPVSASRGPNITRTALGLAPPGQQQPGQSPGYNLGAAKPTEAEQKAAGLANDMRSGIQDLQRLEKGGYSLSPSARAAIVQVATSEEGGFLSQGFSQEVLAHGLSDKDQEYMAALMPVLQGIGHGLGGARLTTSQVRQLLESVVPVEGSNKSALAVVNKNREKYYTGMLGEAGNAANSPIYKGTLGADMQRVRADANLPTYSPDQARGISKGTRFRGTDGNVYTK
jgi:hypothetical protein